VSDLRYGSQTNDEERTSMTVEQAIVRAESLLPGVPAPEGARDERWQAIIDVGDFVETHPDIVWSFARQWGSHSQEDLRLAIAACLLEHLLQGHFDHIFPLVEEATRNDPLFADTFCSCWKMGQSEQPDNAVRFDILTRQLSKKSRKHRFKA
jgi:hypothetical protein